MPATLVEQTRQCFDNVKAIIEAADLTMDHIVFTQVYMDRIENLAAVDEVYRRYFHAPYLARAVSPSNTCRSTPQSRLMPWQ